MKRIEARFDDVCLVCTKKIAKGEMIFWEKKISYHELCYLQREAGNSVIYRWMLGDKK